MFSPFPLKSVKPLTDFLFTFQVGTYSPLTWSWPVFTCQRPDDHHLFTRSSSIGRSQAHRVMTQLRHRCVVTCPSLFWEDNATKLSEPWNAMSVKCEVSSVVMCVLNLISGGLLLVNPVRPKAHLTRAWPNRGISLIGLTGRGFLPTSSEHGNYWSDLYFLNGVR